MSSPVEQAEQHYNHLIQAKWQPDNRIRAFDYMRKLIDSGIGPAIDEKGRIGVSNSQLNRWMENGSFTINGEKPSPDDMIQLPITELVLWSKPSKRVTLWKQ